MGADAAALRNLVTTHAVKYEVWPHYEIAGSQKMMAGFDLELCGTHGLSMICFKQPSSHSSTGEK
jgi:hypothetical protein